MKYTIALLMSIIPFFGHCNPEYGQNVPNYHHILQIYHLEEIESKVFDAIDMCRNMILCTSFCEMEKVQYRILESQLNDILNILYIHEDDILAN